MKISHAPYNEPNSLKWRTMSGHGSQSPGSWCAPYSSPTFYNGALAVSIRKPFNTTIKPAVQRFTWPPQLNHFQMHISSCCGPEVLLLLLWRQ